MSNGQNHYKFAWLLFACSFRSYRNEFFFHKKNHYAKTFIWKIVCFLRKMNWKTIIMRRTSIANHIINLNIKVHFSFIRWEKKRKRKKMIYIKIIAQQDRADLSQWFDLFLLLFYCFRFSFTSFSLCFQDYFQVFFFVWQSVFFFDV